jgi:hypothetical protein
LRQGDTPFEKAPCKWDHEAEQAKAIDRAVFHLPKSGDWIYQCPRAYTGPTYRGIVELLGWWRHWQVGAIQVRDCEPGLADYILLVDAEVRNWHNELAEQERSEQERKWQKRQN